MKFVLVSDLHLTWDKPVARKDDIKQTQLKKLRFILRKARQLKAMVLQAGDFFHRPRNWYLLSQVIELIDSPSYRDVDIGVIFGQHDTYMYSEDTKAATSLGVLVSTGLVLDLSKDPIIFDSLKIVVHGVSYGQKIPEPFPGYLNILVIHAPISDQALYPSQEYSSAKKFLRLHSGYDLILCGDIHRHFAVSDGDRFLVNTGPVLRLEASEYNFEHQPKIGIYDTDTKDITFELIPCEPAEKVLSREHFEIKSETQQRLDDFIRSIKDRSVVKTRFEENIWEFIRLNSIEKAVEDLIREVIDATEE